MSATAPCPIQRAYRPRRARESPLYRLVEDHLEQFKQVYDDRFARSHGFWRPEIEKTLLAFLDCGVPELGFARLRCPECRRELFVSFSCKTRGFCPSCQAKRSTLWAEWVVDELLLPIRHHQWVFTIPKRLRLFFLYDRALLGDLARCAFATIRKLYHQRAIDQGFDPAGRKPGVALAIHTHGDFSNWQPHLHCLVTAGVADQHGEITPLDLPWPPTAEADLQARILRLLKRRERLTPEQDDGMLAWAHSGFSVHSAVCADPSSPKEMTRLARYLLHPPIALERLEYCGKNKPLVYSGRRPDHRTGAASREFHPLDFLADLCLHIPPSRMHLTRLYGAYSTRHRIEQGRLCESSKHSVAVG